MSGAWIDEVEKLEADESRMTQETDLISRKEAIDRLIELAAPVTSTREYEGAYDHGVADSIGVIDSIAALPSSQPAPEVTLEWRETYKGQMWVGEDEEENAFVIRRGKPGTVGADTWTLKLGNNILAMSTDLDYLKALAQSLQNVLDGAKL